MKKRIYLFVVLICGIFFLNAQDQFLLNANQSLLNTNPSFAGSNGSLRNQFVYWNRWPAYSGNSVSYYNGLDAYVKKIHGGVALSALIDNQSRGLYKSSQFNLIYAQYFEYKGSGLKIIPSIQLSYIHKEVDFSSLTFGSPFTQWGDGLPSGRKDNLDASVGLLINYKNFYAGGTVFHINQPDVGITGRDKLPARLSLNASYDIPLNEKTLLNFSGVFNHQQEYNALQLTANAVFFKHLIIGLGLQLASSIVSNENIVFFNLGYRSNFFSLTAGYDREYSRFSNNAGSWQAALGFSLRKKEPGKTLANFEKW